MRHDAENEFRGLAATEFSPNVLKVGANRGQRNAVLQGNGLGLQPAHERAEDFCLGPGQPITPRQLMAAEVRFRFHRVQLQQQPFFVCGGMVS